MMRRLSVLAIAFLLVAGRVAFGADERAMPQADDLVRLRMPDAMGGGEVALRLRPTSVRRDGQLRVIVVGESGPRSSSDRAAVPPPRTLRGESLDGSGLRFVGARSVAGPRPGVSGLLFADDGARAEVTPDPHAPFGLRVVAVGPPKVPASCGMPDEAEGEQGGIAGDPAPPVNERCAAAMACDADFEYFSAWGSVEAVVERIELVTAVMNEQWERDLGLRHELTTIVVRTAAGAPYTSSAHATLLNQFRDEWNANQTGIERDVAQLFTGKELNGTIVGVAFGFGEICDVANAYCLAQSDFDGTLACATDLSAHELGHLWNATHCVCVSPPSTMNASIVCANSFQSSPTPNQILAFAATIDCLDCTLVDCNGNGVGDLDDIAAGTSEDCDGNNIPDECDILRAGTDCNDNGILDICDAIGEPTFDCNGNGIFDACDLASGVSVDHDRNGVPDECDPDCNGNGVADGVDLLMGTSFDCDANGEPDECQWADGIGLPVDISADGAAIWNDQTPTIAGATVAGVPTLVAVWTRSLGPWGTDAELVASRSIDAGHTWSAPQPVVENAPTNTGLDITPRAAAFASDGASERIAVVWASNAALNQPGVTAAREIQIVHSDDGGQSWSSPRYVHPNPFGAAVADATPAIAAGDGGRVLAVWQSKSEPGIGSDGDIVVARSDDGGISFTAPVPLVPTALTDAFEDSDPRIAHAGGGRWLVAWVSRNPLPGGVGSDTDVHASLSVDNGLTWSLPFAINPEALTDTSQRADIEPTLIALTNAGSGEGGFAVAWSQRGAGGTGGSDFDVLLRRSADGVVWEPTQSLSGVNAVDEGQPALAGRDGMLRAAWRVTGTIVAPLGNDQDILVSRSDDGGATWSEPLPALADAAVDGSRQDARPALGAAEGGIITLLIESSAGESDILAVELAFPDCNANGIADWCDIAGGSAADANGDGVPDGCVGLPADLDGDGSVGPGDLAILLGAWGGMGVAADLDGDGTVGASDLALLLGAWTLP